MITRPCFFDSLHRAHVPLFHILFSTPGYFLQVQFFRQISKSGSWPSHSQYSAVFPIVCLIPGGKSDHNFKTHWHTFF